MNCYHCGAATDNGLALCELCQRKARLTFEFLPIYFRNLARWRPGRAGSRPVPGSRALYDGSTIRADSTGDRISDALDETHTTLTTWARVLVEARPHYAHPLTWPDAVLTGNLPDPLAEELVDNPARTVTALCAAFDNHLTSVATLDWCGALIRDLNHHETRLCSLTESLVPGWYAGSCRTCNSPTYIIPGLTWVTCRICGATTAARDHLDIVLNEATDWTAPPRRIAEAIVALVDTEQSIPRLHERIKKWQQRGRIEGIWRRERQWVWDDETQAVVLKIVNVGAPRYRLGDVLDVLLTEGATPATAPASAS